MTISIINISHIQPSVIVSPHKICVMSKLDFLIPLLSWCYFPFPRSCSTLHISYGNIPNNFLIMCNTSGNTLLYVWWCGVYTVWISTFYCSTWNMHQNVQSSHCSLLCHRNLLIAIDGLIAYRFIFRCFQMTKKGMSGCVIYGAAQLP